MILIFLTFILILEILFDIMVNTKRVGGVYGLSRKKRSHFKWKNV